MRSFCKFGYDLAVISNHVAALPLPYDDLLSTERSWLCVLLPKCTSVQV